MQRIRTYNIKKYFFGVFLLFQVSIFASAATSNEPFGSFTKPFSIDSLWNSRPVNPKFANFEIPTSKYFPAIQQGSYSTGVFLSKEADSAVRVYGYPDRNGIWDPDSEQVKPFVTIPHWPKDVIPAQGTDGHADIVDESTGVIHSFWKLKFRNERWYAEQYAWTKLDGRGWGDPAHYFQGARATGVPALAGIIRQHEINDESLIYQHALAISLTDNGLSPAPTYVYPATSADTHAQRTHTGQIPEGALLMLPPSFDESTIKSSSKMKKIVRTLKSYGAYVVDENYGTPFVIYVETGPIPFKLNRPNLAWDSLVSEELNLIRANLRQVLSAEKWINGLGDEFPPNRNLNLLSMRGPWTLKRGDKLGKFDTLKQELVFEPTSSEITQENHSGRCMQPILWAVPKIGELYKFQVVASGGAKVSLRVMDKTRTKVLYETRLMGNDEFEVMQWPSTEFFPILFVTSGVGVDGSSVRATLIKINP